MFNNKKNIKARLVAKKIDIQNHFDGYTYLHNGKDIVIDPVIILNNIIECHTFYDAVYGTLNYLDDKLSNLNASKYEEGFIKLLGDVGGTGLGVFVNKIRGMPISNSVPGSSHKIMKWNGSEWSFNTSYSPVGNAGGDLSVSYPNPNVSKLSIPGSVKGSLLVFNGSKWEVLPPGPDNYVLEFFGVNNMPQWTKPVTNPPGGSAGGVLSGTFPNPSFGIRAVSLGKFDNFSLNTILGNPADGYGPVQSINVNNGIFINQFNGAIVLNTLKCMSFEEHFVSINPLIFKLISSINGTSLALVEAIGAMGVARLRFGNNDDGRISIATEKNCYVTNKTTFNVRFATNSSWSSGESFTSTLGFFDGYNAVNVFNQIGFTFIKVNVPTTTFSLRLSVAKDGVSGTEFFTTTITPGNYYTLSCKVHDDKCVGELYNNLGVLLETKTYFYGMNSGPTTFPNVPMYCGCGLRKTSTFNQKDILYIDYMAVTMN